jgi:hypothetical protein
MMNVKVFPEFNEYSVTAIRAGEIGHAPAVEKL